MNVFESQMKKGCGSNVRIVSARPDGSALMGQLSKFIPKAVGIAAELSTGYDCSHLRTTQ